MSLFTGFHGVFFGYEIKHPLTRFDVTITHPINRGIREILNFLIKRSNYY